MARNLKFFSSNSKATLHVEGYQAEINRIIDYQKATGKISIRRKIGNLFLDLKVKLILNIINSTLSLILILIYIYGTTDFSTFENLAWGATNFIIHVYLLLEYLLRFYGAKDRKQFFYSYESIIDLVSLFPFFAIRISFENPFYEDNSNIWVRIGNMLCLMRFVKIEGCLTFIVIFSFKERAKNIFF